MAVNQQPIDVLLMMADFVRNQSAEFKLTRAEEFMQEPISLKKAEVEAKIEGLQVLDDCTDIKVIKGSAVYLYSDQHISTNYAKMMVRVEDKDLYGMIAETVRDESRMYPRPTEVKLFQEEPFSLTEEVFQQVLVQLQEKAEYADIREVRDSNGTRYLYSEQYLTHDHARGLVEWKLIQSETP